MRKIFTRVQLLSGISRGCLQTIRQKQIIYGKPRHYGIKINHTDGFPRCIIDHNVIQLGIIMCNT